MDLGEIKFLYNFFNNNYDSIYDILSLINYFTGNINSNIAKVITFLSERKFLSVSCWRDINIPKSSLIDIIYLLERLEIINYIKSSEIIKEYNIYSSSLYSSIDERYRLSKVYEIKEEFYIFFNSINLKNRDVIRKINKTIEKENKFIEQVENKEIKVKTIKKNNVEFYKIIKSEDNNVNYNNDQKIWDSIYKEIKGYLVIGQIPPDLNLKEFKMEKRKMAMNKGIDYLKVHDQLNDQIINFISKKIDILLGIENEI